MQYNGFIRYHTSYIIHEFTKFYVEPGCDVPMFDKIEEKSIMIAFGSFLGVMTIELYLKKSRISNEKRI
jgi:hypothetical protein